VNAFRQIVLVSALILTLSPAFAEGDSFIAPPSFPGVSDILQKVTARAKWVETQGSRAQYCFDQVKITEDLDDNGTVKKKKEQVFHITPIGGVPYARLTRIGGKLLSEKELKAEDELERKFRARLASGKAADEKRKSLTISNDLLNRFDYSVIDRDTINGRDAYLIRFAPKSPLPPEKDLFDRFLNRMAGRVWVDSTDFEAARLEIELQESVDIFIGLIGSLKKLDFTIERQRLPDGFWVPAGSHGEIQSRKLFISSRTRYREQTQEYKKLE
jgi:hypothetical protein